MALPQFQPRAFEQILQDMINFVRTVAPQVTDFNIGSIARTYLEAAAWEDDEQYTQMAALLRLWNLSNVRGITLDERLAEYNLIREGALSATGTVVISNTQLVTSFVTRSISVGDTVAYPLSSLGYPPTISAPYTIRVGEGLSTVEDIVVSANDTTNNALTTAAFVHDHAVGERISLVSGANILGTAGTQVSAPASGSKPNRTATLLEDWQIIAGNYSSLPIPTGSNTPGVIGNISAYEIGEFTGGAPFDGAIVRNEGPFSGGVDEESDEKFLDRGRKHIQSLARSTVIALQRLLVGVQHTTTSGRVYRIQSASIRAFSLQQAARDFVHVYLWPGSFDFVTSTTVSSEQLTTSAEDGQKFFELENIAIVPGSLILEIQPAGAVSYAPLVIGTDYFLDEGRGDVEILDPGLSKGDAVRATSYTHYTGMIQEAQKVINGAVDDPIVYPGVAAAGVKVLATFPRPRRPDPIRVSIQAKPGFSEIKLTPQVIDAITRYLTELPIGADVILAEITERAMSIPGMFDMQINSPSDNIILLEDEILDLDNFDILIS